MVHQSTTAAAARRAGYGVPSATTAARGLALPSNRACGLPALPERRRRVRGGTLRSRAEAQPQVVDNAPPPDQGAYASSSPFGPPRQMDGVEQVMKSAGDFGKDVKKRLPQTSVQT